MNETIRQRLLALVDEKYREFHSKLVPGTANILGVRLPLLRELAKEIARGDWRTYLVAAEASYYEELMIEGLVIGYAKADIEEILRYTATFVPKIKNWGICDSFCNNLKITKKHPKQVWEFLQPYLQSRQEFELRFGVVMLLSFYIEDKYIDQVLARLDAAKHDGYYVKMAVAWAVSICFIKYPDKTMSYLRHNTLDDWTYNKALQKIIESLRVDKETKLLIGSMKRK